VRGMASPKECISSVDNQIVHRDIIAYIYPCVKQD